MYHQYWYPGEEENAVKCPELGGGSLLHFGVCRKQLAGQAFVKGSKVMKISGSRTTNRNSHWLRPYGFKFTAQLPSSPDVSLNEFHFFVHVKKTAVGRRFVTDAAVKRAVASSTDVDADFFRCGIQALAPRWDKCLTFRHRASCILGQAFRYSPVNAFYIFNQQIYFIFWYLLDRASLI